MENDNDNTKFDNVQEMTMDVNDLDLTVTENNRMSTVNTFLNQSDIDVKTKQKA